MQSKVQYQTPNSTSLVSQHGTWKFKLRDALTLLCILDNVDIKIYKNCKQLLGKYVKN